jgi:hypothetical protein
MGKIIGMAYKRLGTVKTAEQADNIKALGLTFATKSGATIAISDIRVPGEKTEILADAEKRLEEVERSYQRGLITNDERYQRLIAIWSEAKDNVTESLLKSQEDFNPVNMMMKSGARGNISQLTQLAGMRGLMADPSGRIVELPVKANFREGLTVLEYFVSTHGTRKGLVDTGLRTADSGYLTRRLVDVAHDVVIREDDCGTTAGITWTELKEGDRIIEPVSAHIVGRTALYDIEHPATGEILVYANEEINEEMADRIRVAGITEVTIRSVLTCRSRFGLCRMCYGRNLATGHMVDVGEAVGIIAAQSIGEPGTQLMLRSHHTGGVAGDDIARSLPLVEELFEARKPKEQAFIAEFGGVISICQVEHSREITVIADDGGAITYSIPYRTRAKVRDGALVEAGDELTEGSANPHDLLRLKGLRSVQIYLLREVQKVYTLQGVDINDKHIEVIARQMLRHVRVEDPGDTELLPGGLIDIFDFEDENERVIMDGGVPAFARPILLGITQAALATDSFLAAASFQETTRVLTDAAIKGKRDPLLGLKENVIMGKLVPAGTGMNRYCQIRFWTEDDSYAEQLLATQDLMWSEAEDVEREDRERLTSEQAERERLNRDQAERERLARAQAERERLAREQAERERLEHEQAERERLAHEQAERERLAREQAERERLARQYAERERLAREQAERERLAREQAERERLAREQADWERVKLCELERADHDRADLERIQKTLQDVRLRQAERDREGLEQLKSILQSAKTQQPAREADVRKPPLILANDEKRTPPGATGERDLRELRDVQSIRESQSDSGEAGVRDTIAAHTKGAGGLGAALKVLKTWVMSIGSPKK